MKKQKWKIGALLVRVPYSPVVVVDARKRREDGKLVVEYKVAPGAFAASGVRDYEHAYWVREEELRCQPE